MCSAARPLDRLSCVTLGCQLTQHRFQMSLVAGRQEIGLVKADAVLSKDLFRDRKPAFVISCDTIEIASQDPISPTSGAKERKAVDKLKIGVPIWNSVRRQAGHQRLLTEAQQSLIDPENHLCEGRG